MGYIFFGNSLGPYSRLNIYSEQLLRNGFLHFGANLLSEIDSFFLMNQKAESINRLIHYMNNHLDNISTHESIVLIFEGTIPMGQGFKFVHKIDDNLSKRQIVLDNVFLILNICLINESSPSILT
jgi:hypothetical protein